MFRQVNHNIIIINTKKNSFWNTTVSQCDQNLLFTAITRSLLVSEDLELVTNFLLLLLLLFSTPRCCATWYQIKDHRIYGLLTPRLFFHRSKSPAPWLYSLHPSPLFFFWSSCLFYGLLEIFGAFLFLQLFGSFQVCFDNNILQLCIFMFPIVIWSTSSIKICQLMSSLDLAKTSISLANLTASNTVFLQLIFIPTLAQFCRASSKTTVNSLGVCLSKAAFDFYFFGDIV